MGITGTAATTRRTEADTCGSRGWKGPATLTVRVEIPRYTLGGGPLPWVPVTWWFCRRPPSLVNNGFYNARLVYTTSFREYRYYFVIHDA